MSGSNSKGFFGMLFGTGKPANVLPTKNTPVKAAQVVNAYSANPVNPVGASAPVMPNSKPNTNATVINVSGQALVGGRRKSQKKSKKSSKKSKSKKSKSKKSNRK
jgi:hypothetical protein